MQATTCQPAESQCIRKSALHKIRSCLRVTRTFFSNPKILNQPYQQILPSTRRARGRPQSRRGPRLLLGDVFRRALYDSRDRGLHDRSKTGDRRWRHLLRCSAVRGTSPWLALIPTSRAAPTPPACLGPRLQDPARRDLHRTSFSRFGCSRKTARQPACPPATRWRCAPLARERTPPAAPKSRVRAVVTDSR